MTIVKMASSSSLDPSAGGAGSSSGSGSGSSHPLLDLLHHVERDLKTFVNSKGVAGEAGDESVIRERIYGIIQAQTKTDNGAIYNSLKCSSCSDLLCYSSSHAEGPERDPVTLTCGHTSCRGCLRGWYNAPAVHLARNNTCPDCRAPVITGAVLAQPKAVAIADIAGRLKPRRGGSRRRTQRKRRSRK